MSNTGTPTTFRRSAGLQGVTRLLFLSGRSAERDAITLQQLNALGPDVHVTTVAQVGELLDRIRQAGNYHAVVISHALPQSETLTTIKSLRKASAPIAIVPVVTESQRDLYSSAVAGGADDVLIQIGGVMVHAAETLNRAKKSPHLAPQPIEAAPARPPAPAGEPARPSPGPGAGALLRPLPASPGAAAPVVAAGAATPPAVVHSPLPAASAPTSRPASAMDLQSASQPRPQVIEDLEKAVTAAQHGLRQAEAAHAADRAGWKRVREELQARLAELESVAADRIAGDRARELHTQELEERADAHQRARQEWETSRRQLETRIHELEAAVSERDARAVSIEATTAAIEVEQQARASSEEALAAARRECDDLAAELARTVDAHESERRAWDEVRADLDRRAAAAAALEDQRADLESRVAAREAQLDGLRAALEAHDRDWILWEETREALTRQVADLEAAEATLRAELDRAVEQGAAQRDAAEHRRRDLESRLSDAEARAAELQGALEAHDRERSAWDEARRDLEQRGAAAAEAFSRQKTELEAALEAALADRANLAVSLDAVRAEQEHSHRAHADDRDGWERERREILAELERAERAAHDLRSAVAGLEAERQESAPRLAALELALDDTAAERNRLAARHERLLRTGLVACAVTTLDGRLISCDDGLARLLGYGEAAALARPEGVELITAIDDQIRAAMPVPSDQVFQQESCLNRADGSAVRVLEAAMIAPGAGGDPVIERVIVDLSSREALESQLRAARRLGEAGRLAAAIVPDVDALSALVDRCVERMPAAPAEEASPDSADALVTCAAQALPALRQLLAFIRKQARDLEPVDLNTALERTTPVLARLVGPHVDFSVRAGESGTVTVDLTDFEQMVTTLFITARDLLPAGGSLLVETDSVSSRHAGARPGRGIPTIAVTAQGIGVQTCEPPASLLGMVERCAGVLTVDGEPDRSSRLTVRFTACGG